MDKTKVDTAFAASTALLAAAEGANTQALRTSLEGTGKQPAQEFDGFLDHLRDPIDRKQDTQKLCLSNWTRVRPLFARKVSAGCRSRQRSFVV